MPTADLMRPGTICQDEGMMKSWSSRRSPMGRVLSVRVISQMKLSLQQWCMTTSESNVCSHLCLYQDWEFWIASCLGRTLHWVRDDCESAKSYTGKTTCAHSGISKSGTLLLVQELHHKSFPEDLRILTLRLGGRPIKTITKFNALFDGKAEARSISTTPRFCNTQVQGIVLTGSGAIGQCGQTNEPNTTIDICF